MRFPKFLISITKLLLFFLFLITCSLYAKPKVDRGSLRFGYSPRLKRYSWATLAFKLANPDKKSYDIEVRFVDDKKGAVAHRTVFADIVTVPPETQIYYKTPVMTEISESYHLEVFVDGKQQVKGDPFIVTLIPGSVSYMVILNDSDDVLMGAFVRSKRFKGQYFVSNFTSSNSPTLWNSIRKTTAIIVIRPDLKKYSSETFRAILDYVHQGGNIIFIDPETVIEAAKTPLAVLLPVKPLRIRKIHSLPELAQKFPSFKGFKQPVDFLESVPVGDGVNFVEDDGMPVFRWKKYGLGTCRFSAIPITQNSYENDEIWQNILSFFIAHQEISNDLEKAVPALDEMTGFAVPGIGFVRIIFLIYFVLIIVVLSLGRWKKRTGLAWLATAGLTMVFSGVIMKIASTSHSKKSGTFLSFIETEIPGKTASNAEGWYGIFSTADRKITIKAKNEQTSLSAIPPLGTITALFNKKPGFAAKGFVAPTEVKKINGIPVINNLVLNSNSSRQFFATFEKSSIEDFLKPEIVYEEDGFKLKDWVVPDNLKPVAAWLQFANGIVPLKIKDTKVFLDTSARGVFSSDTSLISIKDFMLEGWKHSSPMLILIEDSTKNLLDLKGDIISHGKKMIAVPVKETCKDKSISIPPQSILLNPAGTSSRTIFQGNRISSELVSRGDNEYIIKYQLPPMFAGLKADKIVIDFQYINDGGNVEVKPLLVVGKIIDNKFVPKYVDKQTVNIKPVTVKNTKRKKKRRKRRAVVSRQIIKTIGIEGELQNGEYVFNDVGECLVNGEGFFILRINLKNKNLPIGEKLRANKWNIKKLDIKIKGTIPNIAHPVNFN